jgi:hypothetical protein
MLTQSEISNLPRVRHRHLTPGCLYYAATGGDTPTAFEMIEAMIFVGCSAPADGRPQVWHFLRWHDFDEQKLYNMEIDEDYGTYLRKGFERYRFVTVAPYVSGVDRLPAGGDLVMHRIEHRAWQLDVSGRRAYLVDEYWTCHRTFGIRGWAWAVLDEPNEPTRSAVIGSGRCALRAEAVTRLIDTLAPSAHARVKLIQTSLQAIRRRPRRLPNGQL